jgi:hypothetical protein
MNCRKSCVPWGGSKLASSRSAWSRATEVQFFALYAARQIANQGPALGALLHDLDFPRLARELEEIEVIRPKGGRGAKGFHASFSMPMRFKLEPYGFGWRGRDVGYYAGISILAFLDRLTDLDDDPLQQRRLLVAANLIGRATAMGSLIVPRQHEVALAASSAVWELDFDIADDDGEGQELDLLPIVEELRQGILEGKGPGPLIMETEALRNLAGVRILLAGDEMNDRVLDAFSAMRAAEGTPQYEAAEANYYAEAWRVLEATGLSKAVDYVVSSLTTDDLEQARGRTETQSETKECPDCAETIKMAARVCRFCGHRLDEPPLSATA